MVWGLEFRVLGLKVLGFRACIPGVGGGHISTKEYLDIDFSVDIMDAGKGREIAAAQTGKEERV